MKRLFALAAAAAMLASTGVANAEESQGTVKSVDQTKNELVLEDGTVFTIGEAVMIEELQPGQEVTVSYETKDGKNEATSITVNE